jgi:molybdenum cofactor biosynthesis protein B
VSATGGETSARQHEAQAAKDIPSVRAAIVTVSDTRTEETDTSGRILRDALAADGHTVAFYRIVKDDSEAIHHALNDAVGDRDCDAIIFNGGTGITKRDTTFDVLDRVLEKRLVGFGEIFRYLSYLDIGPAAVMSRATAGTYRNRIVISIPGSSAAVRLAWEKLIGPQLPHMVWELVRQG